MKNDPTLRSLSSKTGDAFDRAFIEAMTAHHDEAISMAELALNRSSRKEILTLATNIISAQSTENAQMQLWKSEWSSPNKDRNTANIK